MVKVWTLDYKIVVSNLEPGGALCSWVKLFRFTLIRSIQQVKSELPFDEEASPPVGNYMSLKTETHVLMRLHHFGRIRFNVYRMSGWEFRTSRVFQWCSCRKGTTLSDIRPHDITPSETFHRFNWNHDWFHHRNHLPSIFPQLVYFVVSLNLTINVTYKNIRSYSI